MACESPRHRGLIVLLGVAADAKPLVAAVPLGLELVDRSWLGERSGRLPQALVDAIDDGLRAVLGV